MESECRDPGDSTWEASGLVLRGHSREQQEGVQVSERFVHIDPKPRENGGQEMPDDVDMGPAP